MTPRVATRLVALSLVATLGGGCASLSVPTLGPVSQGVEWFARPAADDPWSGKIAGWQARERGASAALEGAATGPHAAGSAVSGGAGESADPASSDDLRSKYLAFRRERKRAMAREVADWIQREARSHYRPDGPIDHWATLEETLAQDGDDCDGLELLVYHFLRDLGFSEDEVYRAIVVRPSDNQHHMVTLWFERPNDPYVIDPTGAMTTGMPRMSEVPGWVPIKLFTEEAEYTVEPRRLRFPPLARR